ncbi:MAG TPA: hypothetical protein VF044_02590 [Actinomycetota bacterium]
MRRCLLLVVLAVAAAAPAAASPEARSLRLAAADPLALAGRGFAPRELVRVDVRLGDTASSRRVRASASGVFRTTFRALAFDRCRDSLRATARGRAGVATLKLPQAACPPPLSP